MADSDDLEPPKPKPQLRDLSVMSIEALGEYIAELEAEIDRVKTAISEKQTARASADTFFKS
jgi:uncharacterized small protein (DUF1192 family)